MNLNMNVREKREDGFTLLELLIVVSIIAILSVALVLVLNPAEALKKSRDAQRLSDLSTLKTALGIMLTSTSTPSLDNFAASGACLTNGSGAAQTAKVYYSSATAGTLTSSMGTDSAGTAFSTTGSAAPANPGRVDGTGWVPTVLSNLVGGSPISNYPLDPTNTGGVTSTSLSYRYVCQNATGSTGKPAYVFEIDTVLESAAYGVGSTDDKSKNDGGDNDGYYEVGNSLKLLGAGTAF